MTAPGALPTREEIAELLEHAARTVKFGREGEEQRYFVLADALLARLRPAWERMELVIERVREHATKYDHHAYLELLMTTPVSHAWVRSEERDALRADLVHLQEQIKALADFIMVEVPGEPSQDQGAVDTAIRIMRQQRADLCACVEALEAECCTHPGIGGCYQNHNCDNLRAALARPGVQEAKT